MAMNPVLSFAADDIQINTAKIEYSDDTYKLLTSFSLDFNHSLEETLSHGIPLYFKTEIEINRPRTFWFDEVPVSKSRTTRISYNVLTRQIQHIHSRYPAKKLQYSGRCIVGNPLSPQLDYSR